MKMSKLILKPKNFFLNLIKLSMNSRISTKSLLGINSKVTPPKPQAITLEWLNHANLIINSNMGKPTTEDVVQKLVCNRLTDIADFVQNCADASDPTLTYFRELYQSGTELDHFIRGKSILLLATSLVRESNQKYDPKLLEQQIQLAKLTEFTHLAFVLHHKIVDSRENADNSVKQHNKIITILGDNLISYVFFNLAQTNQSVQLLNEFGTLWQELSEGLFSNPKNVIFKKFASMFAHSFKSILILSCGTEETQVTAFEFGKSFGLYLKAIQDIGNGLEIVDEQKMKIFKEIALTNLGKLPLNEQTKQCFFKLFDVNIY